MVQRGVWVRKTHCVRSGEDNWTPGEGGLRLFLVPYRIRHTIFPTIGGVGPENLRSVSVNPLSKGIEPRPLGGRRTYRRRYGFTPVLSRRLRNAIVKEGHVGVSSVDDLNRTKRVSAVGLVSRGREVHDLVPELTSLVRETPTSWVRAVKCVYPWDLP